MEFKKSQKVVSKWDTQQQKLEPHLRRNIAKPDRYTFVILLKHTKKTCSGQTWEEEEKWRRVKNVFVFGSCSLFLIIIMYYINKVCRWTSSTSMPLHQPIHFKHQTKKKFEIFKTLAEILFIYIFPPHLYNFFFTPSFLFCGILCSARLSWKQLSCKCREERYRYHIFLSQKKVYTFTC